MKAIRRLRTRACDEGGVTLVELVVSISILGVVMVAILSVLTTVQKAVVREDLRGRTNDEARLALQSLDRQVRSGNLLYPPASFLVRRAARATHPQAREVE